MTKSIWCRLGFHKWVVVDAISRSELRSQIRNSVAGQYLGTTNCGHILRRRTCLRCECGHDEISVAAIEIEAEERAIFRFKRKFAPLSSEPEGYVPPAPTSNMYGDD